MRTFHAFIIKISHMGKLFLAFVMGFALCLWLLRVIGAQFASVTQGHLPFDLQNELSRAAVSEQLSVYTSASRLWYWLFAAVDFAFPLLGGLFTAPAVAFLLRHTQPRLYAQLTTRHGFVYFTMPMLFDWLENIANLLLINFYPPLWAEAANAMLTLKQFKLITLFITQGALVMLFVIFLITWPSRLKLSRDLSSGANEGQNSSS
ncbi:MAG: hypothetical protein JNL09_04675 [Anaerolineales bacterium]|nr:hypothetical protein [Anaerolineales bacterium]